MAEQQGATASKRRVITQHEAAEQLGISHITVKRHCLAGTMPSIKIGRFRLIPVDAFEAYLAGTWEPKQGPGAGQSDGRA